MSHRAAPMLHRRSPSVPPREGYLKQAAQEPLSHHDRAAGGSTANLPRPRPRQAWDETQGSEFHDRMSIRMAAQFEQHRCMQRKGLERKPKGIFETARAHAQPPPRTYRDVGRVTSTRLKAPAHRTAPRAPHSTRSTEHTHGAPKWLHGSAFHAPQEDSAQVEELPRTVILANKRATAKVLGAHTAKPTQLGPVERSVNRSVASTLFAIMGERTPLWERVEGMQGYRDLSSESKSRLLELLSTSGRMFPSEDDRYEIKY